LLVLAVLNGTALAASVVTYVCFWTSILLKSSTRKGIGGTAENDEKVSPLKAKRQWVYLPEDDLADGRNMLQKIHGCYFCNFCVRIVASFAVYFL
jgi:hypothetical protein